MPELSSVIRVFSKFLDPKVVENLAFSKRGKIKKLQTIDDILALPIYSYKFLDEKEAKILEEVLDIFDIEEAAQLDKDDPFAKLIDLESTEDPIIATEMREKLKEQIEVLKEKFPNLLENLKKTITISSLIQQIKDESFELEKKEQKVVVVGLDNAGKTAILSKFGGKLGIGELTKLKPTKGVERKKIVSSELELFIWDMGGQAEYRERYLENPEQYFLQIDLLLYVLDVLDWERYEESIKYFKEILKIIKTLEEKPYLLIFLHKYDPDIKNNPEIILKVEMLKDVLLQMFKKVNIELDYEIYLTSIYSLISNEPKFAKYLKNVMQSSSLTDPTVRKVEGLGKILEETMNAVIRLSESISLQLMDFDNRLKVIESGAFQMAQSGVPMELAPPPQTLEATGGNVRLRVLDELKDLFAKKRRLEL